MQDQYAEVGRQTADLWVTQKKPPVELKQLKVFLGRTSVPEEDSLAQIYRRIPGAGRSKFAYQGSMLTHAGRYSDLDNLLVSLIETRFDQRFPLRIHDMAASNAITSYELFEKLRGHSHLEFIASDYHDALKVVTPPEQSWSAVLDRDGIMLQVEDNGAVFTPARRFRWSRLAEMTRSYFVRQRLSLLIRLAGKANMEEILPLWHPKCVALAESDRRFVLRREDLFNPQPGQYDVLRIMGTIARFSKDALPGLFAWLLPLVVEGGLFVAGDTGTYLEDTRRATIFERRGRSFISIGDWNGGFSLRADVERVRLPEA